MAEVMMGPIIRPLVSLVKEKAMEQYEAMEGMEEQLDILKRQLPAILDVITNAEEQAPHRARVNAWLEALKKVAYEANDAFDEFKYEALRREARKDGHYVKLGVVDAVKLFPSHNRIAFRYRMGNKLRKIVQRIGVLVKEMNNFGFRDCPQPQVSMSMHWRQNDPTISDHTKNIAERSREKDKKKVVDILLGQASNVGLTVVPIVGMGGLGKTTLAQLVYNDTQVQKHFQLPLWVCVSENFDVDSLAESIVKAAPTKEKDGSRSPLDRLQNVVSAQRYLLVLDDVWKTTRDTGNTFYDKWQKLKARLQHGGIGSAVLTTTRDGGVAQEMGTVEAYKLTALEKSFVEEIIKTRAFHEQEKNPELLEMVGEIVERCVGSPLAATALGSVLRTKTTVEEWKAVLKKSTICNEETGILSILKLSYDDLPSHMKQCFAFCAVFPKDYEIDVDKMIQIWMANGFIPTQNEVCPETIGKQIFNELASRSFFQDVKQVPVDEDKSIHGYCSRITCKIHDLMHDVAQSVMQKECVTITEKPSQTELFPSTARHLFLSCKDPQTLLNDSLKKTSAAIQTLLCEESVWGLFQYPSKYSSVRALRLSRFLDGSTFLLKPKHLHHLRYLDLSGSGIEALPEDISILYNLQTLNLSGCYSLRRLPRQMKYMNALRHLNTDRCLALECMPPDLRRLTSLQTLTCFVVGTPGSDCSNLRELQHFKLCGRLELRQLENVTEADAKVANLGNKKGLTELTLSWSKPLEESEPLEEEDGRHHTVRYHAVLQGLEPHDGLRALTLDGYQGTTLPTRMGMFKKVVKLCLSGCQKLQKLPPLCKLPELQLLILSDLRNLKFLCSGDTSFTFPKLKELKLDSLPEFERWCEIDGRQGGQIMFPQLENLFIESCEKLTALPDHKSFNSAFPELKVIELRGLNNLKSWGVTEGTDGEQPTFPNLEDARIVRCPELTSFPEAPKLSALHIDSGNQHIHLRAARYMTSLSSLKLSYRGSEIELPADLMDGKEKRNHESPMSIMNLEGCNFFFRSSALALWKCFVQLQDLKIWRCDGLVHWPEKEFQSLVSLRTLKVSLCSRLTGYAQPPDQSPSERSRLLPCLESLHIVYCESLVEVFDVAASLKIMDIDECPKLELKFWKQEESAIIQPGTDIMPSTAVPKLLPSATELFLPCLESLQLCKCHSISELLNLPSTLTRISIEGCRNIKILSGQLNALQQLTIIKCRNIEILSGQLDALQQLTIIHCDSISDLLNLPSTLTSINIDECRNIEILSGQLDALQQLTIDGCDRLRALESCSGELPSLKSLEITDCRCLAAIPNGPQAYTSLQSLTIFGCPGMKSLPRCLQQRLGGLERKYVDARFEGPRLSKPETWKYAVQMLCKCLIFTEE